MNTKKKKIILPILLIGATLSSSLVFAEPSNLINVNLDGDYSNSVNSIIYLTTLMLAPFVLMCCTSFPRYIMSLSFLRQSMGLQSMPSNQILIGVAFFMTMFTMQPTFDTIIEKGYKPYSENQISSKEMMTIATDTTKDFMLNNTSEKYLLLFAEKSGLEELPESRSGLDFRIVAPAFLLSEFTKTFWIGLLMYSTFVAIDFIVASVLMSMGMVMLPPATISILIKLLVFLAADGWYNVIQMLMNSFT